VSGPRENIELQIERNSAQNLDYYSALEAFMAADQSGPLQMMRNFAVYTPRQFITDFLVRYELFKLVRDVAGSVLEFGVMNGQGLMSMAQFSAILEPANVTREIIGFDTFEGFPDVSARDGEASLVKKGGFKVEGAYERLTQAIKLYDANRFIGHVPKVRTVKGNVLDTLPEYLKQNPHTIAALVYMDLDLYEPTKFVLGEIMDRVPKGAVVAFDELNHRSFPGETLALLETLGVSSVALKRIPFCSRISYFVR
jgi:hypothetical protein